MHEPRNLKLDLLALALLALTIFLAAALISYDPGDPPSTLVHPARHEILNICGRSGAMAATVLFSAFGLGAYYLVFSLATLDAVLLGRKTVDQPWLRLTGWLLSLVGVCTFMAMAVPYGSPGPVIGSGGYLGATGRGFMELNFASVGAYILTISFIVAGLMLATDYVLVHLLALVVGKPAQGLGRSVAKVGSACAEKLAKKRTDLDDLCFEGQVADGVMAVRIAGRPEESVETPVEETVEADPVAEEPTVVEPKGSGKPRKSLASMLGLVKKPKAECESLIEELAEETPRDDADYELPNLDMLLPGESFSFEEQEKEVRRKAKILEKTFADFGFNVRVVEIQTGPVIAQFEVELEAGLRLSKITSLADDLAIALRVPSVRIVAPIPGKNTVGVEVPNINRQIVRLREVMEEANGRASKMRIPMYLGKDVAGAPMVCDLASLPHLLIAGRTGTGKSVCLNSAIVSMLMTRRPDEVRMLLIDPKMVELSPYKSIPHLMHPVVTDMRKAEAILAWAVEKMEERYHLLARAGVRHISNYNQLGEEELMERIQPETPDERKQIPLHMPYIVIVADELADLMMTSAKEVEGHIIRLAQKSRAVGIHLVLATQKPTVDVITGLIKSNLPARICFQVASRTDSRVVLDEMGADKLLGNGDMLFLWPGTSTLIRGQGTYLSDDEINRVIGSVSTTEPQFVKELVQLQAAAATGDSKQLANRDELYEAAIDCVVREGRGSVSLLQRALGIGYGRGARLIDFMAEDGIVGPYNGSQAREVLLSVEDWEARGQGKAPATSPATNGPASTAAPRRSNKICLSSTRDDESDETVPAGREKAEVKSKADDDDAPFDTDEDAEDEDRPDEEDSEDSEDAEEEDEQWDNDEDELEDADLDSDSAPPSRRKRGCA
jgi:S-DNA-T family DNA segregation ATPase FtsK/SpoIIIE